MQHLRRIRHYGPATFVAWAVICAGMLALAGFSLWPH